MANYLLEMQLAEDLTFTEIRFISSALKQGANHYWLYNTKRFIC